VTLTFRASTGSDLEALLAFSTSEPVAWTVADRYRQESAARNHRPEWSFLAERDGRPVGRAIWWGGADAGAPSTLDDVIVSASEHGDRVAIAAGLIRTGAQAFGVLPEWIVDVAVDWHDDPSAVAAVSWRADAAQAAGLVRTTERVSVAWTPSAGVPDTGPFRFVLATRTAYDAAISSIGVLPQHRGRGVVDALLGEGLRVHADAGETRVVGTTDAANTPMRRAFECAGFVVTKRRIVFDT